MKDKLLKKLKESYFILNERGSQPNKFIIPPMNSSEYSLDDEDGLDEVYNLSLYEVDEEDADRPELMGNHGDCKICQFFDEYWDDDEEEIDEGLDVDTLTTLDPEKDKEFDRKEYLKQLGIARHGKQDYKDATKRIDPVTGEDERLFSPPHHDPSTYGDREGKREVPVLRGLSKDATIKKTGINIAKDPDKYLDLLRQVMTSIPDDRKMFGANSKLAKSGDASTIFYDFTLPAYRGIYYSEKHDDFQMITTCPSAKECKKFCYARKGNFTQYPANNLPRSNMLSFLINHPQQFIQKMIKEIKRVAKNSKRRGKKVLFRWHDSGDFFSATYARMAFHIAEQTPEVHHYAYTKQINMMKNELGNELPANFTLNFSYGSKNDELIDKHTDKYSYVIKPETDFNFQLGGFKKAWKNLINSQNNEKTLKNKTKRMLTDLKNGKVSKEEVLSIKEQYKDATEDVHIALRKLDQECMGKEFRRALENKLGVKEGSIITYFEMIDIPENPNIDVKWNVLVYPGCGDVSAARSDVAGTLLLIH